MEADMTAQTTQRRQHGDARALASVKASRKRQTKADTIQRLLKRAKGTTIAELQKATGWQPHSVRAALTGLRRAGLDIVRTKQGNATRYRIAEDQ